MKIVFFELEEWEKEFLNKKIKNHQVIFLNEKHSNVNVEKFSDADIISVFIYSKINKEVISKF
jgi:D-lactate dehydrogenase